MCFASKFFANLYCLINCFIIIKHKVFIELALGTRENVRTVVNSKW